MEKGADKEKAIRMSAAELGWKDLERCDLHGVRVHQVKGKIFDFLGRYGGEKDAIRIDCGLGEGKVHREALQVLRSDKEVQRLIDGCQDKPEERTIIVLLPTKNI